MSLIFYLPDHVDRADRGFDDPLSISGAFTERQDRNASRRDYQGL